MASHRSAARLWRLDGNFDGYLDVVVPTKSSCHMPGVRFHRSTQFSEICHAFRSEVPVTQIDRTLIDLAAVVSWKAFEAAIDDALRRRLTNWDRLLNNYFRLGRRGRNGSAYMRAMLESRYGDETIPLSAWSRWVALSLAEAGLPIPELEYRICDQSGGFVAQVDLAYPNSRLAIELQSIKHHTGAAALISDSQRFNRIRGCGWRVVTITWHEYQHQPERLADLIRKLISNSPAA